MAVIEATTYELVVSVANSAITLSGVISTQLLYPVHATGCTDEICPANTVHLGSVENYLNSNGPSRFSNYTYLICKLLYMYIIEI